MRKLAVLLAFVLCFSGCAGQEVSKPLNETIPTNTAAPLATNTPLPEVTSTPTLVPSATSAPLATSTPAPMPTATSIPLPTGTPIPTPTGTPTPTPSPMPDPTNTPIPTPTVTPTPSPTSTPTPTPTVTPTPSPTSTPTPTPSPTPAYTYTEKEGTMYIIADSQQYYDIPDMSGTVNGTLEKGDEVQVKGICNENGWYQVSVYYQKIYEYIPAEALSATRPEISFTEIEPTKMWLIKDAVLREYPSDTAKSIKEITWVPTGAQVLLIGTSTESEYCKVDYYGYTGYILVETLTDTIPEDAFPYELLTLYSDETGIYYYRRIARYKTEEELAKETELNQEATHLIGDIGWEKLQELDKTSIYYGVRQSQPISYPGLTVYKMIAYYHFNEEVKFSTEEEELVQTAMSNQKSVDIRKTSGIITYENKRYVEESMFQEYYASLDLSKKTVNLNILKDNEGTAKNFRDCFGFDYNTCDNAFELFTTCKEAEGYEPDLKAYTMDNTSFYGWSEYIYRFKEGNALIEEMTQVLNEWYGSEAVTDNSIYFERNEAGLIIGFCAKVYIEVDNKMYMYYRDIDFGYPIS